MANTDIVTAINAANPAIVGTEDYLGQTSYIPVSFTADAVYAAEAMTFSKTLPPKTKLIGIHLTTTAIASGELDIGYTDLANAIIDGAALTSAGDVNYQGVAVDVGGKAIIGTLTGTMSTDSIYGYILVATGE